VLHHQKIVISEVGLSSSDEGTEQRKTERQVALGHVQGAGAVGSLIDDSLLDGYLPGLEYT